MIIEIVGYFYSTIDCLKGCLDTKISMCCIIIDLDSKIISENDTITLKLTYNHEKNLLITGACHCLWPLSHD